MNIVLNAAEARVLGSLVEKDITTPDYYPLSLNALINACNQKNNREPVTNFDEETVRLALRNLSDKQLAGMARGAEGRVAKYEHRLQEVYNFTRPETAILCVLLLRGPQTPGELRGRGERMHRFEDLDEVSERPATAHAPRASAGQGAGTQARNKRNPLRAFALRRRGSLGAAGGNGFQFVLGRCRAADSTGRTSGCVAQ